MAETNGPFGEAMKLMEAVKAQQKDAADELARELFSEPCQHIKAGSQDQFECEQCVAARILAFGQQAQAQARLEEAKWWRNQSHEGAICSLQDCEQCRRIAELEKIKP